MSIIIIAAAEVEQYGARTRSEGVLVESSINPYPHEVYWSDLMSAKRVLMAGATSLVMAFTASQTRAQPKSETTESASRIFKSGGMSAAISGLNFTQFGVEFQLVIRNDRTTPLLFSPVIMASNPSMAATTTNGVVYVQQTISGAAPCDGHNSSIGTALENCMKEFQVAAMTRLEPGDITAVNVTYVLYNMAKPFQGDEKISTALKFLVRTAPSDDNSLDAAAKGKSPGSPSIVTINFPLVPVHSQQ